MFIRTKWRRDRCWLDRDDVMEVLAEIDRRGGTAGDASRMFAAADRKTRVVETISVDGKMGVRTR